MIFNGKEIRVLSGAIIVFLDIPLSRMPKRKISEAEYGCSRNLFDRIMTLAQNEYEKIGAMSWANVRPENPTESETIRKRLSVTLNLPFSGEEMRLVSEAVDVYIAEAEARGDGKSMNVYYSGDMYGLDTDDFKRLSERIRTETDRKTDRI